MIANGFTDDLFPVDEALRYYNLVRSRYPSNAIGLIDPVRGKRCNFLQSNGRLSKPRSCNTPIRLAARGTTTWVLSLHGHIASGRFRIRSDAVDGFHHHQRPSSASVTTVTIG